jgi:hypothetical protein
MCNILNAALRENGNKITISSFGNEGSDFSVDKVVPYGFPFRVGMKFINLQEESTEILTQQRYVTSHQGLVTLTYDLLKGGFILNNSGESLVKIKPMASGFGVKVISDNSCFIKIPLSTVLVKLLMGRVSLFELVNFIQWVDVKSSGTKAYDLVNDVMIFDQEVNNMSFSWKGAQYYKTVEDFNSNIPKQYSFKLETKINQSSNDRKIIAPPSLVYFLLSKIVFNANVDVEFETKATKANLDDLFFNSTIKVKQFDIQSSEMSSNFSGSLTSEGFESNKNYIFAANLELIFKNLESLQPYLINLSSFVNSVSHAPVSLFGDKERLQNLLKGSYSFKLNTAGSYSSNKKIKNLNLETFYFMINDDIGFNARGQSSFSSAKDWYLDSNVLIYNFAKIVDEASDLLVSYEGYNPASVKNFKEPLKLLLRGVSSNPMSSGKDLVLDLKISHDINSSKIGKIPLGLFLENYDKALQSQQNGK